MDQAFQIILWVGGIFIFILSWVAVIKRCKARPQTNEENAATEYTPTTVETKATVVDQGCCVKMVGTKTPKAVKEFTVVFQTEDGKLLKQNVPEEMYDGFEPGQRGLLTLVDGELYGFIPDE